MRLHKSVVLAYGSALAGSISPGRDPVAATLPEVAWRPYRQRVFDDLSAATVYSLDAAAAAYADSFRESLTGGRFDRTTGLALTEILEDVEIPHDLVWMEHDHARLMKDRFARGYGAGEADSDPDEFGTWGVLLDNRSPLALRIELFRTRRETGELVMDPLFECLLPRREGHGDIPRGHIKTIAHEHMTAFYEAEGFTQAEIDEKARVEIGGIGYESLTMLLVFALMASPDNGLVYDRRESLAPPERRTARKFGRPWVEASLRDHVVIRIGPRARRHLDEQAARHRHERSIPDGRAAPVEHWVSEHERRYKSGKVVLIRAHRRGTAADDRTPRRVVGPRP